MRTWALVSSTRSLEVNYHDVEIIRCQAIYIHKTLWMD